MSLHFPPLSFAECVRQHAAPEDDLYVAAARRFPSVLDTECNVEIDDRTVTSHGDGGAWVMAWLWVTDEEAGIAASTSG